MHQELFRNRYLKIILALFVIAATAGISSAATFYLKADVTSKTMPDTAEVVPMWGYAQCNATFTTCGDVMVPGPELTVPVGDSTLTINLKNNLPVPTSIVIPGLIVAISPKWDDGSTGSRTPGDYIARVMSFNTETAAGGTVIYTWNNVPPGTRLYESGTNPAVQIQMGLYGAVKKNFAAGQAYSDSSTEYNSEKVLLFSAIDPAFNMAVATGNYIDIPPSITPVPGTPVTSAIDYMPKYFIINGNAYSAVLPNIQVAAPALLRFLNAGLRTYVPIIHGTYMSIIAEDGNLLPYKKEQYSLILPAGKTMDAILKPATTGIYPIYDRRLNTTNSGLSYGGMNVKIEVTSVPTYSISGIVQTAASVAVQGVTITLSGDANSFTTTAADGTYSFAGLSNGNYTVTPTKTGYNFTPASSNVNIAGANTTANFTAVPSLIVVTLPNGGETWTRGTTNTIRWTYTGNPGSSVRIELLKGGVLNRTINSSRWIGGGGIGSYNWTVPTGQTLGSDYTIRVTSTTNAAYTDTSNNNFTIAGPTITVALPNGGETWTRGTTNTIRWTYTGNPGNYLRIELWKAGTLNRTIALFAWKGTGGIGSYNWTIPSNQTLGIDYRIKVTSTTNAVYTDTSNNDFRIQ